MKRSSSDYWKLYHDDFWDSETVRRMQPRTRAAYLYLLGLQAKHGHLPANPETIASLCAGLFPWFMRWDWPTLQALFPVCADDVTKRRNHRQSIELAMIDESLKDDARRKRVDRAKKADRPPDVQLPVEKSRGDKKRGEAIPPHASRDGAAENELPFVEAPAIPEALQGGGFPEAWADWIAYRKRMRFKPWLPETVEQHFREWAGWGAVRTVEALRWTMKKQYQGIVEPKAPMPSRATAKAEGQSSLDALASRLRTPERTITVEKVS